MSQQNHDVLATVLCENIVRIPELDVRAEVINISTDRSEIGLLGPERKEWYHITKKEDGELVVTYNHKYGTPGYEQMASYVSLELVSR